MNTHIKKTVLVIDDDPCLNLLMTKALQKINFNVVNAKHGKMAIELLSQNQIDLILVDLMMPEMDGLGFLRWLRKEAELSTPVLVLTGRVKKDTEGLVLAAGADALLFKPVELPVFLAKIQELTPQP